MFYFTLRNVSSERYLMNCPDMGRKAGVAIRVNEVFSAHICIVRARLDRRVWNLYQKLTMYSFSILKKRYQRIQHS